MALNPVSCHDNTGRAVMMSSHGMGQPIGTILKEAVARDEATSNDIMDLASGHGMKAFLSWHHTHMLAA